ncbi:hypothetical protein LBK6_15060 [Leptospira borgpetersenii serovar Hardjo]|nr:hypothetical protein LBK6_15060 [Leptospira borgpetersenii serovar Hardjo]AWV71300.1 hypothetical protein B9T54_16140 [Leptospira borgpetersenii serovar Hardjo-bovis]TQE54782.1 hypothetical protein FFZ95_02730 [Leptospira borgpetersenii]AMX62818.1 hypothetical protein LBK9_14980 [Leptospira borgpetersenii serovar Hardjo]AMX66061.1 hypothetical protein LBK30_14985 [Leptospira borgpetersenii serovar Hardjo]
MKHLKVLSKANLLKEKKFRNIHRNRNSRNIYFDRSFFDRSYSYSKNRIRTRFIRNIISIFTFSVSDH